jgi:hypothetical protein
MQHRSRAPPDQPDPYTAEGALIGAPLHDMLCVGQKISQPWAHAHRHDRAHAQRQISALQ